MKKFIAFFMLISVSSFTVLAHSDHDHYGEGQDITVKTTKVSGNVYMLQGRGGNIGAIVGPQGILIIDDDYKVVSEKLREALKELGSATPKFIINTHWHGDHTEGNEFFGKDSIIISHDNVRKAPDADEHDLRPGRAAVCRYRLADAHLRGQHHHPLRRRGHPREHYPNGHTDGDSVIFFPKANVVHMGDDFFAGRFPFVDLDSGGSVQGMINNVTALIAKIPADAKIIPGHGPLSTLDDLKAYRQTLAETSKIVQDEMKKKKPLDEIKKAGLPDKYKEYGSGFIKTDAWIETVYKSYSKK